MGPKQLEGLKGLTVPCHALLRILNGFHRLLDPDTGKFAPDATDDKRALLRMTEPQSSSILLKDALNR
jgi:hypothetical protein